jgi:hypothetical protein
VREPPKVELSIRVVSKDVALLVAPRDDVIHGARELQTRRARHQGTRGLIGTRLFSSVFLVVASADSQRLGIDPNSGIQR